MGHISVLGIIMFQASGLVLMIDGFTLRSGWVSILSEYFNKGTYKLSHQIAQAVSRWLLIATARVRSQV
jgi:hypothetical protein